MKDIIVGIIVLVVLWAVAGLILWGAVATGQYFFALGEQYKDTNPAANIGAKIGGVLFGLTIGGLALPFLYGGAAAVGVSAME